MPTLASAPGWSRRALCLLLLSAALLWQTTVCAAAEDPAGGALAEEETYGKSPEEILALGFEAWFDYYTGQAGDSTLAHSQAGALYTEAARQRNAGLDPGYYSEALRQLMYDFGERLLTIGPNMSGGGTIWTSIGAAMPPGVEDVTYALRGGSLPAVTSLGAERVERQMEALAGLIEGLAADSDSAGYFKPEAARQELQALRAAFRAIRELAAELPREDRDRVLAFCSHWLEVVVEYGW